MDTIQKQKIGLCIGGTKMRQSGFTPLVISGILACDIKKMDRVSLVQERPAYIITHTNEYILYQLIDSYVKAYDSDTSGLLSIALTIKKDVQLADGKSPYSLLREAYDKFRSEYMRLDNKGYENFLNKDVNPTDFDAILEQYPLEERLSEYILMSSDSNSRSGKLCVPQEKLEDLFRDSQYPEFAQFKEIEIGVDGSKTLSVRGLENIEIPRPQIYAIEVNGKRVEQKLIRRSDSFNTARFLLDTEDVKYEQMSFSLGELLDAPIHRFESGNSSVVLDKERNLIVCKIDEKRLTYLLEYEIIGGTEEERIKMANWILHKEVKLTFGGKSPEFFSLSSNPRKTFIPASWAHEVVSYQAERMVTFGFQVASIVDDERKHVKVTITIDTPQRNTYSDDLSKLTNRKYSLNDSLVNTPQPYKGQKMEEDHEEDLENLQPSDTQYSDKAKKRWILLMICCFVGVCIGAGIVGATWWMVGEKKLTRDDSLQIAKEMITTTPIDRIISKDDIKGNSFLIQWFEKIIKEEQKSKIPDSNLNTGANTNDTTQSNSTPALAKDNSTSKVQPTQEEVRDSILVLVNNGIAQNRYSETLKTCRKVWNPYKQIYFQQEELNAIEAILDLNRYKTLSTQARRKIMGKIGVKFGTYKDVIEASNAITNIMNSDTTR